VVEAASISAGVIAAIVIASALGFAIFVYTGRKGIKMLMRKREDMGVLQDNPMYASSQKEVDNPFYKSKD